MIKKGLLLTLALFASDPLFASGHGGGEENTIPVSNISYFELAPEIVTNYETLGNRIGYLRVKVQIMVDSPADIDVLQYYAPELRDIVITTLYRKQYNEISTLQGRQEIITTCKKKMEDFLKKEEDRKIIRDVIFTNFIFQ